MNLKTSIVHIFGETPQHYPFMREFLLGIPGAESIQQSFWAWSRAPKQNDEKFIYYANGSNLLRMMRKAPADTRFVFHGMFDRSIWPSLTLSTLIKRASWVCWGAEIYQHFDPARTWKQRIAFCFQKIMVPRMSSVFALNAGDAELIKKHLRRRDIQVLPYPLIASESPENPSANSRLCTRILVGNSAHKSNHHIEALESLAHFAGENVKVILPLNYAGEQCYIDQVIARGEELFADKFEPITAFMSRDDYDQLLASIDVAVFAHRRQQGLYVAYSMLKYKKKLYLRDDVSSYQALSTQGFSVFPANRIKQSSFEEFVAIDEVDKSRNAELMLDTFSVTALQPKWLDAMHAMGH